MPRLSLTGSRIRAKRLESGLKQVKLAQSVGISPAYLNLIEHNRRRIGGKLLLDLAHELQVDAVALSEGTEATLMASLADAASQEGVGEVARADEFAGRFPGWANVLAAQHDRINRLEHTVATLADRLTHDPYLSTSLHEVLSTAASIRSTASILAGADVIEPEWQMRFQRNLLEDAKRLADGAGALVSYLDGAEDGDAVINTPVEELEEFLAARQYHLAEVEAGGEIKADGVVGDYIGRYRTDAARLPLAEFQAAKARGLDPVQLAAEFGVGLAMVLRRIATLPLGEGMQPVGLVSCDGSGTLTFRKAVDGFAVPRFGAACPLWPLYQALLRPQVPIRMMVEQAGRDTPRFLTYAIAEVRQPTGFDGVQIVEAVMLIVPEGGVALAAEAGLPIGTSCRVCPRDICAARREASILAGGEGV
ncbi:MAG: transcriptional regulator [Marinosulfonomonas sp.]|nr:MAG: transcriptional regulator [Marinosulfonomonas sp.]